MEEVKNCESIVDITTESGFKCRVDKRRMDNWRITRAAVKVADSRSDMDVHRLMMIVFDELLDAETQQRLEEYASVDGIPQTGRIETEISDIMDKLNTKNS